MSIRKAQLSPDHLDALARNNLGFFCRGALQVLRPTDNILWNWHMDVICNRLEDVLSGKTRRLIINIPPRYGKSLIVSVAFSAFILGHDPTAEIIGVSYAGELSKKMTSDIRRLMNSAWYKRVFPTRLVNPRARLAELKTRQGGSRLATSVDGTLTGRGGNFMLIDDPLNPTEARSDVQRRGVNDWFDGTATTRANDKSRSVTVIIMQRLHQNDLVGHVLARGDWEVLSLPAIAELDEVHEIRSFAGTRMHRRLAGEALHPERQSLAQLGDDRVRMGSYDFAAQMQQRPAPLGGGLFKQEWLNYYDPDALPQFDMIVQSYDTAWKVEEIHDWSVGATLGIVSPGPKCRAYLLDVTRQRLLLPDLRRLIIAQAERFNANHVLIEDCGSGIGLLQGLKADGFWQAQAVKPVGGKLGRFMNATPFIEAGNLLVPPQAPWLPAWVDELSVFPNGAFDDQVDATSQAIKWVTDLPVGFGFLEYYREEMGR